MSILVPKLNISKRLPEYVMYIFVIYTLYIQYRGLVIPNAVTMLGALTLGIVLLYMLVTHFNLLDVLTPEITICLTFYFVTFFTGIFSSPHTSTHISRWTESFLYFLLSISMVYIAQKCSSVDKLAAFFCLFSLLCAVTLFIDPVLYRETSIQTNIRYSLATTLNVNTLGTYFMFGCWCMLFLMTFQKKLRFWGIVYLIAMLLAINKTGSRKNLIAIFILVVLWLFLIMFWENKRKPLKIIVFILVAGIGVYIISTQVFAGSVMALRMQELIQDLTSNSDSYNRINMYKQGWNLFKEHPLFGVGFYGYAYYFGGYSHTTFMEVLSCTGVVGSILYFGMYVYSICKIIWLIQITKYNKNLYRANMLLRLALILWAALLFMAVGVIHIYLVISFISFGILFATIREAEQMIKNSNCGEYRRKYGPKRKSIGYGNSYHA